MQLESLNTEVIQLRNSLEQEKENSVSQARDNRISEYSNRMSNLIWSMLGFGVTIYIFFWENDSIPHSTSLYLLAGLVVIHIIALIYNITRRILVKREE